MTKELKLKMRGHNTVDTARGTEKWHATAKANNRAELLNLLEKNESVTLEIEMPYGLGKLHIDCDRIYGDNQVVASFDKDMSLLLQTCELLSKVMEVSPKRLTRREADDLWEVFAHVSKSNNLADGLPTTENVKDITDGDRMDPRESERMCSTVWED